ncbi:DinB family protein [Terriglobus sp. 2YAB30_2]|uniref:DinB family protein n=1 Tax=unclassified Terriglobus TaxID=2628988 RepID=UPI003F97182D
MNHELQAFLRQWEHETKGTLSLLRALPLDRYELRPDEGGRSMGELAWHLAEVDAFVSLGIEQREFRFDVKPAHIERPRAVEALAPGFEIVHRDAVARVKRLETISLEEQIRYADGTTWTISDLLWRKLLLHSIHHRGQLTLMCRLAGGTPPALFGRTREQSKPVSV